MKYDVIVIGGGSAGCVLATRLTEDANRSVLLLEAGPEYTSMEQYPDDLKYGYNQTASAVNAPHNWSFLGTPTTQQGDSMPVPRGKVVGGSSAINGQVFLRGVPEDYDGWAAMGNEEWSFLKCLPYFRKLETDTDIRDDFHGFDGPIPVRRHKRHTWLPAQTAFHQACLAARFPEDPDMNNPDSVGVGPIPMNNPDGIRMSTAMTYLNPVRHRLNLTVKANVRVHRLRFEGKRVTGAEVESGGERFVVEGGELILTAGAIMSPQLLMLSGVGPADHLREMGIELVHPRDRERLREAVRLCARLLEHGAYRDIVEERLQPTDEELASDDALDNWMRQTVSTSQHISGTCKMGPASDPMSVVDQYGRVYGLEGLRVADASVMPDVIRANTNASTIMIAERVADFIRHGS
jgi:choline dehydrogenase-like flavoprotein